MIFKALFILLCCIASVRADDTKSILFIAGKPSHAKGAHEFHAGCDVLAKALEESGMNIETTVLYDKWPESSAFDAVDAVVIYCDGDKNHILNGHEQELQSLSDRGVGFVALHYAVDGEPGLLNQTLMNVVGGYYNEGQSQNPIWLSKDMKLAKHPVANGVMPFEMKDEWYYNIKLGDVTPIMSAVPPGEDGKSYTLVWTHETEKDSRGAGFTGGHYHKSWVEPNNRKLVLNLIVWTSGIKVPSEGVTTPDPIILINKNILQAVARGDAKDLKNHLLLGADINQKNKQSWSLLHFAAVRGKTECATILIANGIEIDPRTSAQKTPLHYTADRGFLELTKLMVENGAKLNQRDAEGWTPLHYAAEKDRVDVATFLLSKGAKVDVLSILGGTPLHEAAASSSPEMINLLLKNGANKNIKATNGKTPLDYAIQLENKPVADILK